MNPQDFASRGVVIGHDHRANEFANSKDLADVTAATFLAKGFKVFYFKDLVHTPLVVQLHSVFSLSVPQGSLSVKGAVNSFLKRSSH